MPVPIAYTLTSAVAAIPLVTVGLLVISIAQAGIVFVYVASTAPFGVVTLTVIVHEELAGTVPPVKVTVVPLFETEPGRQVVAEDPATYVRLVLGVIGKTSDKFTPL